MSVRRFGVLAGVTMLLLAMSAAFVPAAWGEEPDAAELTSSPTASLTIIKAAQALSEDDATVFSFDGAFGPFTLADGEEVVFAGLAPGSYTVSETLPAGWVFEGVTCLGVEPEVSGTSASVTLQQGQPAACTFASHQERVAGPAGSLTIVEETAPAGGEGFAFDAGDLGGVILADGESHSFVDLAAGSYTVVQAEPGPDLPLHSVECTGGDFQVTGETVTVDLGEGQVVVCTFINGTGALPQTGMREFTLLLLAAGVWVLLAGLGAAIWPWIGRAHTR